MQPHLEKRAHDMVKILKGNCGFVLNTGTVVARCEGAPYTDSPTPYDEVDLNNAIELKLLEKRTLTIGSVTGSTACDWYTVPR
jgi:hypothetical protein